jgi:DNA-binding NtrC family response regulator
MKPRILVVEDDTRLRLLVLEALSTEGYDLKSAESFEDAVKFIENEEFDVLLTDVNLPGKSGLDLLPLCHRCSPRTYLMVMTGYGSIDTAVQAMKLGASDFLCKPIPLNDLISAVKVAVEKRASGSRRFSKENASDSPIIGRSIVMMNLLEQVNIIAPYKINVLITGETGTGKELIARAIHQTSPREKSSFVAMNCAAVPEHLLEDELFGHVKGAFTGAQGERKGRFEQADGGTLFLDEIGDMNLAMQSKLLRVLQESEFERLGSSKTVTVDVRVVAATSADLERKILDGSFRADLYHRLNVVHLRVPALRERPDDIMPLSEGLLDRFTGKAGLPAKSIASDACQKLVSYNFPGNVRQLQNAIERAAIFSGVSGEIRAEHLPEEIKEQGSMFQVPAGSNFAPTVIPDEGIDFSDVVSQLERNLLIQTLDKTGGNKLQAAKLLNLKRTTLVEKIKRLQIDLVGDEADAA